MVPLMKARVVGAETLDGLAADDPAARRSRRDLQRIHRVMGTQRILLGALVDLGTARPGAAPLCVLELGAGDGSLLLGVAEAMHSKPATTRPSRRVELSLLDRQRLVAQSTIERYAQAGWTATACVSDVAQWVAGGAQSQSQSQSQGSAGTPSRWDLILANLFLHHFECSELAAMFGAIAARCERFFACEPRRGWAALAGSHLVGALGANAVTRGDAVLSVRAGFAGQELSALWPAPHTAWRLREYSAAPFSHCFEATRSGVP